MVRSGRMQTKVTVGFTAVIVLGLGTFVLAASTFSTRLRAPFHMLSPTSGSATEEDLSEALLTDTKDTDRDGIPDIQELQVYRTSPFLEDTDSDGVLDKAEIAAGTDPNCPKGQDCRALAFPSVRDVEQDQITKKLYELSVSSKLAATGIPGLTDAASIRNFLRLAGIPDSTLSQFSDEALRKIYEESAKQNTNTLATPAPGAGKTEVQNTSPSASVSVLPQNPSAQAIRDLLLQGGIDKTLLSQFSDEQLVKLYQDTLKDTKK